MTSLSIKWRAAKTYKKFGQDFFLGTLKLTSTTSSFNQKFTESKKPFHQTKLDPLGRSKHRRIQLALVIFPGAQNSWSP